MILHDNRDNYVDVYVWTGPPTTASSLDRSVSGTATNDLYDLVCGIGSDDDFGTLVGVDPF